MDRGNSGDAKTRRAEQITTSERLPAPTGVKDRPVVRLGVRTWACVWLCWHCAALLFNNCIIKTLTEANQCCHLKLNRCTKQRGGGDHCGPKVHLRGRREPHCLR